MRISVFRLQNAWHATRQRAFCRSRMMVTDHDHHTAYESCCTPGGASQRVPKSGHFVTRTPRDLVGTRSLWRRGNLVLRSYRNTRVFPCLWRLVSQREPREKVPASQRRVRLARTADTRPDLATSARRLVPQTAPCRAYLSIPRVSPRRLPRRSSAFHHSPARRSRRSSPTPSRCAAKVRASSCTVSI